MTVERITQAAMLVDGVTWTLPPPARHCHLIRFYCERTGERRIPAGAHQSFMTSEGRFLDRQKAADVARAAGQVDERKRTNPQDTLFSEDLW